MKSRMLKVALILCMILCSMNVFAANGDMIVNGKLGVGTASPEKKLHIVTSGQGTDGIRLESEINGSFVSRITMAPNTIQGNWNGMTQQGDQAIIFSNNDIGTGNLVIAPWAAATSGIRITTSGNVGIGNPNPGSYRLYVEGNAYSTGYWGASDKKFKENIKPIEKPLDKVLKIEGVSYNWKVSEYKNKGFADGRHYGVIAQDIEKVIPEVVNTNSAGEKSVAYTELVPVLIEAVKEQQKIIEQQNKKIEALTLKIEKKK